MNKSRRPVAPSIRQRAVEMYLDGAGCKAVGKEFGVDKASVLGWVRAAGFKVRSDNSVSDEVRARAVEMYAAGIASEVVGAELGISGTTVTKYARQAKVPIRDRKGRTVDHEEHELTGGEWVRDGLVWRWVPNPPPTPTRDLIACRCGATVSQPCDHPTRVVSRRCPCGNRPREGQDYCTTECRDEAEGVAA